MVGSSPATIKFLCSYGGKILPRYTDGKLRYVGGETRVLSVDRSLSFAEVLLKLGELCGSSVSLRCQLPTEDLDALVSITSDEDLANLIEEYDRASKAASSTLKIRAFLSPPKSLKKISPPPSATYSVIDGAAGRYSFADVGSRSSTPPGKAAHCCVRQISKPIRVPVYYEKSAGSKLLYYVPQGNPPRQIYLVHNGNYWQ